MSQKCIVVAGGGFAGLWSALGAARLRDQLGLGPRDLRILLIERNDYHGIRVRNYEADLDDCIVPFDEVLEPVGIERIRAEIEDVNVADHAIQIRRTGSDLEAIRYDRLVFALGSQLNRPAIAGLSEHAFDVDTHAAAKRLRQHLSTRRADGRLQAQLGVLVVGAGLTGIEIATELASEFRQAGTTAPITLCDASPRIGSDMGREAQEVIATALRDLGVLTRAGVSIQKVDESGVVLSDGERIRAGTVIWCAGMRANPLTRAFGVDLDGAGRLPVDEYLRVRGAPDVFSAGDSAWYLIDGQHASVMSCQHGRPMGRFAGHNVAADLLGKPMLPLKIDWYVTVLDLGEWGAVYTEGWDRHVVSIKDAAKKTKQTINRIRIYPPRGACAKDILLAAAPMVQAAPKKTNGQHEISC